MADRADVGVKLGELIELLKQQQNQQVTIWEALATQRKERLQQGVRISSLEVQLKNVTLLLEDVHATLQALIRQGDGLWIQ